jgi:hypothetical protein
MVERALDLPVVDGLTLPENLRAVLRPGEEVTDGAGTERRLPRHFFEIASGEQAAVSLAPGFELREFLVTDLREAALLATYPRYVPCAVTLLAQALSVLRSRWETYVFIAANGGYRSPAHALSHARSTHCWGTAANIYRVGDTFLESAEEIERFARDVRELLPGAYVRAYGSERGCADDHLHIDLGYAELTPHEAPASRAEEDADG